MSALAGIWRWDGKPEPGADCARMLAAQQIYGPHDGRQWAAGAIAMGRRLFRTVPEDIHDRGPLTSRDGRLTLVADLRLDNREELAMELGLPLGRSAQLCDAALLLESLERWGEGAVDRLVGEFAFALWDSKENKLLLARDFLGQRPLHYHRSRGFFAFTSMAKGLHALPEIPYQVDEEIMAESLMLMPTDHGRSIFQHVERVEPASIVSVTREGLSRQCYWHPQRPRKKSSRDAVEGLRHHLDQAVRCRLRGAEQQVGAHLSAGLDSGAVAATAARLLAPGGGKVIAFTAVPRQGFDGAERRNRFGDEGALAAAAAAMHPNIAHVLVRAGYYSPIELLERHFFLFESPAVNVCNMGWGQAINREARARGLGVVLTGQMGNMTISYHGLELLPELLRAGRLAELWRTTFRLMHNTGMSWRGALVRIFGSHVPVPIWQWANNRFGGGALDAGHYTAIRGERLEEHHLTAKARTRDLDFSYRPRTDGFAMRLWVLRRGDAGNGQKGMLAGWGLDRRDPTGDKRLVEYCLSLPTQEYLRDGMPRALAKRALADRLPEAVLNEQKKGYQAADWHENLTASRAELAAELDRLENCPPAARLLDIPRLKHLVENCPTSGWERDAVIYSYRLALMRGIAAGHFLRKASGANR